MPDLTNNNIPATIYNPSEILGMFSSYLTRQEANSRLLYLRGIYWSNQKNDPKWAYRYDTLRDVNNQTEITLQIPHSLCTDLKDGNLITVGGVLGRKVQKDCKIQIMLVVSRVEIMQEQAIDEDEIKRIEIRRNKVAKGFKNVDGILEQILFTDNRPKVALIFATTSITMADFNAGINAAKSAIDFMEYRENFSSSVDMINLLYELDLQQFDVLCLIRGGGANIESLDDPTLLEAIVNLNTPIIAAIGHVEEKLFIKQIVDKESPTPNGLGQYFSELVESVSEKKSKSRAVLTEQIKKQFQQQLEAGKKQNKELQEKLVKLTKAQEDANKKHDEQVKAMTKAQEESNKKHDEQVKAMTKAQEESNKKHDEQVKAMTKAQEDATKKHNEQIAAIQKQNKEQNEKTVKQNEELQKQLKEINKANEAAQKAHTEQLSKLQQQLKTQTEQSTKQTKEFNESLNKMQETNRGLQKSLSTLTAQNTKTQQDLNAAKEQARILQSQLDEALKKNNKGCSGCLPLFLILIPFISLMIFIINIL